MSETLSAPQTEQKEKYFSFHIKGWATFDVTDKTLAEIVGGIEENRGFLTLVEVLKIEDELASMEDEEARECFANIFAAKRLIQRVHELPENLKEGLRGALKTEEQVAPKKSVTSVASLSVNDESGSRLTRWP